MSEALGFRLSQGSGVHRYRQIVDQLGDQVRAGRLAPGTLLPSVRELAAGLVVSLITVRRAYDELERAGLILRRQGHGTFVAERVPASEVRLAHRALLDGVSEAVRRAHQAGVAESDLRETFESTLTEAQQPEEKSHAS